MAEATLAIALVLDIEKGFTIDSGGPTNWGVTLASLIEWGDPDGDGFAEGDFNRDGRVDILDARAMTRPQAESFYLYWWNRLKCDKISWQPVANKIFDMAVNMGPHQAGVLVQRAINNAAPGTVAVDGKIGPKTRAALNKLQPRIILPELRAEMRGFYERIAARRPDRFRVYLNGWLNRAAI